MRITVYSHDTFGLGNLRRMMAICEHLLATVDGLSILLLSGSPMLQSFRIPHGLDYIKLPCLNRGESGILKAKYLRTEVAETIHLRAGLIRRAVGCFRPDVLLVDKNPGGIEGELMSTLRFIQHSQPRMRRVLLLRDILDAPQATRRLWHKHRHHETLQRFYDRVLVVGSERVFDLPSEYAFPEATGRLVRFCGYIRKSPDLSRTEQIRSELGARAGENLVLVTAGGGEDGTHLVENYLAGLAAPGPRPLHSLIVFGPEMPASRCEEFRREAARYPRVKTLEFTEDLMGYMAAADAVVSMGGYNTVCEILSLAKRAVIVPRVRPVEEQWIRAERLAALGLLDTIHPDRLDPAMLMATLQAAIAGPLPTGVGSRVDLNALDNITHHLLQQTRPSPRTGPVGGRVHRSIEVLVP